MTLKKIRENAGLTQEKASKKLKISIRYLSYIENDKRSPGKKLIEKMAKVYSKNPEEIFLASRRTYCCENKNKAV